ncbi:unnamed protein product [Cylicostephanus goldi]|uniref:Neurotransmitter-gated ion-channel ligand-binding domain-containing protein n=1 Tax=Cylicostephanus goldi TaxID=71465 RepID=A0A3P6SKQ4_CYLGO|nr:unnamed protein product [Cylicostephanus goldi]
MQWFDYKLTWDPARWGGIRKLHIPSDQIWIPDILLYNYADGEPHISIMSDALVYYNGLIVWKPPSIYKSVCYINIEYFPYDSQNCELKFGGWSYNGFLLDVRQLPTKVEKNTSTRKLAWISPVFIISFNEFTRLSLTMTSSLTSKLHAF